MNSLKKFLSIVTGVIGISGLAIATDIPVQKYVVGPTDTEIYKLDDDGDISHAGSLTTTGNIAATGSITATGALTTSASTPYSIKISSITAAVPTGTPTAAGLIAFSTTYVMYVSTGTGVGAWVKIGGQ